MQSVRVQWLKSAYPLLFFQIDPDFTVEDYRLAVHEAWELLEAGSVETFFVAADVSAVNRIPPTMIMAMFKEYRKIHPSFSGLTIFIGAPIFIRGLVAQFQSIFHTSKFGFASHLDEVDAVIASHLQ